MTSRRLRFYYIDVTKVLDGYRVELIDRSGN